jgi:MarR-like DNA-binding transcriptional regulator SgrR of sgrS sRNA
MVLVAAASSINIFIPDKVMKDQKLEVLLPFTFSNSVDPRKISTVGDQVLSEHLFAFHARESIRDGFKSVFSDVEIDRKKNKIVISPKYSLDSYSDESMMDLVCKSFKESLSMSSHVILKPLVKDIYCSKDKVFVELSQIPVNISYLFTLADYSVFENQKLPILKHEKQYSSHTGPYNLFSFSDSKVELRLNSDYPKELRANEIEQVDLSSYDNSKSEEVFKSLNPDSNHLVYAYGYSLTNKMLEDIREKKYAVRQMPSEWMVYIGMNNSIPIEIRDKIQEKILPKVNDFLKSSPLGQRAYSFSPTTRPFGLQESIYHKILKKNPVSTESTGGKKKYKMITLDEWGNIPVFASVIEEIERNCSELIEVEYVDRANINKIWSEEVDMFLSPLGIAPSDPISTFAFLYELRDLISEEEILNASLIQEQDKFSEKLKEFEARIVKERRIIPIGHYPGIVLESPNIMREESLSWSWGIQAWTYRFH